MLLKIIRIGNSQGVRLPKALLEQCDLTDEVEVLVEGKKLILTAKKKAREGWEELFDDEPLEPDLEDWLSLENEFDRENQW